MYSSTGLGGVKKDALPPNVASSLSGGLGGTPKASNPASNYVAKTDNVAANVADVVNQNSPLMKQAKTAAKQAVNSRGLMNSSLGVQAGQSAVLSAAVPIAGQQAQQNFQANQSFANHGYTSDLQDDQQAFQASESKQARDLNDYQYRHSRATQMDQFDRSLRLQDTTNLRANATAQAGNTAATVSQMESLYQNTVANINSNADLPAAARSTQLQAAANLRARSLGLAEQIYRVNLTW